MRQSPTSDEAHPAKIVGRSRSDADEKNLVKGRRDLMTHLSVPPFDAGKTTLFIITRPVKMFRPKTSVRLYIHGYNLMIDAETPGGAHNALDP